MYKTNATIPCFSVEQVSFFCMFIDLDHLRFALFTKSIDNFISVLIISGKVH